MKDVQALWSLHMSLMDRPLGLSSRNECNPSVFDTRTTARHEEHHEIRLLMDMSRKLGFDR